MCAGAKGENWRIGTGGPLALDRPTGGRNGGKQGWARNVRASRVGRQSDGRASRRNTSLPLGQERISLGWVLWRGTRRDAENDSTGNMEAQNCPRLPHNHIYKSRTWARRLLPSRQCADDMRSGRRQRQRGEWDRGVLAWSHPQVLGTAPTATHRAHRERGVEGASGRNVGEGPSSTFWHLTRHFPSEFQGGPHKATPRPTRIPLPPKIFV